MNTEGVDKFINMQKMLYVDFVKTMGYEYAKAIVGVPEAWNDCTITELSSAVIGSRHYNLALEYGCGVGRLMSKVYQNCNRIDGYDLSPEMLKYAKQYLEECKVPMTRYRLQECDGYSLSDIASNTYELVYSLFVLQHISVHEIRYNLLQEFYRVLNNYGRLFLQLHAGLEFNDDVQAVRYHQNYYSALATNSIWDMKMENPLFLVDELNDLKFKNITMKFARIADPQSNTLAKAEYRVFIEAYK